MISALLRQGQGALLEIGPHPVLGFPVQETIDAAPQGAALLHTLRRDEEGAERFASALAEAYVAGVAVDWMPSSRARVPGPSPCPPIRSSASATGSPLSRWEARAPPAWKTPITRCWAPRSKTRIQVASPSPAASRLPPTPGSPTTR